MVRMSAVCTTDYPNPQHIECSASILDGFKEDFNYIILYYIILYYIILYYIILYYIILYYIILCYVMLYYIILYYIMVLPSALSISIYISKSHLSPRASSIC